MPGGVCEQRYGRKWHCDGYRQTPKMIDSCPIQPKRNQESDNWEQCANGHVEIWLTQS